MQKDDWRRNARFRGGGFKISHISLLESCIICTKILLQSRGFAIEDGAVAAAFPTPEELHGGTFTKGVKTSQNSVK
jgi:hypothetical protein